MTFAIKVQTDHENKASLFEKTFKGPEEFEAALKLCDNKRKISFLEAVIIPTRTDNLENFCTDFFFPTLINHGLKIHDLALSIIMSLAFICLDVVTLPIRLFTVTPRYLYNLWHAKESNLFYQYLVNNGVSPESLRNDHVYLELKWAEGRRGGILEGWEDSSKFQVTADHYFHFIQLPETATPRNHGILRRGISHAPHGILNPT